MNVEICEEKIKEFYDLGFILFPKVFADNEIEEMSRAINKLQEEAQGLEGKILHKGSEFVVENTSIHRVVWAGACEPILLKYGRDSRITQLVSRILGSSQADHLINQVHFKLAYDGVSFPFHQDSKHRRYGTELWKDIDGKGSYVQTITAIDESTLNNGPLLFIPQSGKDGHLPIIYHEDGTTTLPETISTAKAVPLLMNPGDVAMFGPYVVHGSFPNNSNAARRVLINGFALPGANKREYPGEGAGKRIEL